MSGTTAFSLEQILNHPTVKAAVEDTSFELKRRRAFVPPVCEVFAQPYTVLEATDRYRFSIDPEARRRLPGIIANQVQIVKGRAVCPIRGGGLHAPAQHRDRLLRRSGAGGHNVIAGLFDAAKRANPENRVFGFLVGPDGVVENEAVEITRELVDRYRNLGGFTMIKTGRAKIDSRQKVELSRATCKALGLDALVIVGGDDSNTNAAFLAEEMLSDGIQVIGVPKTIDGDIQVRDDAGRVLCAVSFGFHTAARAFANMVAGLANDASSDIKYYHVCKVMGRVASHLALEVALQAHPNMTVIGEDLVDYVDEERLEKAQREGRTDYTAYGMTLRHLSRLICEGIVRRAAAGKNYGIIVIPEGVLEFINEVEVFIMKLNTIIAEYNRTHDRDFHSAFPVAAGQARVPAPAGPALPGRRLLPAVEHARRRPLQRPAGVLPGRAADRARQPRQFPVLADPHRTGADGAGAGLPEHPQGEGRLQDRHSPRPISARRWRRPGWTPPASARRFFRITAGGVPADEIRHHLGQDPAPGAGEGRPDRPRREAAGDHRENLQKDRAQLQGPGALLRL
jgi:6-phosphofructokinase